MAAPKQPQWLVNQKAAKNNVIVGMLAFKSLCEILTKLSSDKGISFADMRAKLVKVEAHYQKLRAKNVEVKSRFPSKKDTEPATRFSE